MCDNRLAMSEPGDNLPKRKYQWPWVAAAAVVLAIVLAVVWMAFAVKKLESERDFVAPLPGSAPTR